MLCSAVCPQMSGPKRWIAFDGRPTEVDTPYTVRAKQLKDLYLTLSAGEGQLGQGERMDALLSLKTTVSEHDCPLTREITELVDREAELMQRGMKEASLKGETSPPSSPSSSSVVTCALCVLLTPSLQGCASVSARYSCSTSRPPSSTQLLPATSKYAPTHTYTYTHQCMPCGPLLPPPPTPPHPTTTTTTTHLPQVPTDPSLLRVQTYYCRSCSSYLSSTEFELSSNSRMVGHCRSCRALDNKAREREDHSTFRSMLREIWASEERFADGSRIVFLMQVSVVACACVCWRACPKAAFFFRRVT